MSTARVFGMIAPEANQAILLRRGPSKKTLQLTWDLDSDEIVAGQWIKGRVYERRCDVSPDGRYFVGAFTNYSASRHHARGISQEDAWRRSGWTAISRPPYFTALALWFCGGAWNGGGIWSSSTSVRLNNFSHVWDTAKPVKAPVKASNLNFAPSEDDPIYSMLLKKRGWSEITAVKTRLRNPQWAKVMDKLFHSIGDLSRLAQFSSELLEQSIPKIDLVEEGVWERRFPNGRFRRTDQLHQEIWQLLDLEGRVRREWKIPLFRNFWLEADRRGDILFAESGCLFRWTSFPDGQPAMVADLNPFQFQPVAPPEWALEW